MLCDEDIGVSHVHMQSAFVHYFEVKIGRCAVLIQKHSFINGIMYNQGGRN